MKKMMFIAVMMAAMLMPAQMMAKNNPKARIENRVNNRKDFKAEMKRNDRRDKKFAKAKPNNRKFRDNRPMRKPRPVIYHNHCCDNDVVEATATIIGIAALAAMLAD